MIGKASKLYRKLGQDASSAGEGEPTLINYYDRIISVILASVSGFEQ